MSDEEPVPAPAVLDATVLSNFASTDALWILPAVLPRPQTVPAVQTELEHGIDEGYTFLERADAALEEELPVVDLSTPVPDEIATALDPGEAEAMHVAQAGGGTLVSDDRDARSLAETEGIPVTGSLGVLVRGIKQDEIDIDTADSWLEHWQQEHEYYSPVESVSELLPS